VIALTFLLLGAGCLVLPLTASGRRLRELSCAAASGSGGIRPAALSRRTESWLPVFASVATGLWIAVMVGIPNGLPVAAIAAWAVHRGCGFWLQRRSTPRTDPLLLAAGWDLLAAGMRAGLPISVIVRTVADEFTGPAAALLHEVAALHDWGADPASAWEPALNHPDTAELARAARRSVRVGSGIADIAADLAADARSRLREHVQTRAERVAVWVSAPLALCFLPGFLCLGVLPVVVGMVQQLHFLW
jgi:Flp pilus assembly protein TadB